MIYSHIVACSLNNGIGLGGNLPWRIKEDLIHFKELTSNHPILVGHNTFCSIGKVLPNRLNLVISRDTSISNLSTTDSNIRVFYDLDSCLKELASPTSSLRVHPYWNDEVFIIGGAKIYKTTLDLDIVSKIYLTLVHKNIDADSFYPAIDTAKFSVNEKSSLHKTDSGYEFEYITYERTDR